MHTQAASLVAFALLSSPTAGQPIQWTVEAGGNGHFYEAVFVGEFTSWHEARDLAQARGGHLATITSAAENEFVFSLVEDRSDLWTLSEINNGLGPWLGGFQDPDAAEPDQGWQWVTGESWDFRNWASGEPSEGSGGQADSLHFFGAGSPQGATWNDALPANVWDIRGYVVEYIPAPGASFVLVLAACVGPRRPHPSR